MRGRNFCLLSLLIFLAFTCAPCARGYTGGKPLKFDLYHDYLIVARGSAGPLKDLNFLFDTGANPTVLDRRIAQKLHLQELPGVLAGISGRVQAGQATVPSLQFGPIQKDNLPVVVVDLSFFDKVLPVRIDAVIGLDVVGQGPFEIDYPASQFIFGPIPSLKSTLSLEMKAGLPTLSAELNHLSAHLLLDTGASSLILFAPKAPPSIAQVSAGAVQKSSNMMGEFERKQLLVSSLRLGQTEFRRQPAFLVQSRGAGTEDLDGLMSPALLGIRKLAIDVGRGVVEFSQ